MNVLDGSRPRDSQTAGQMLRAARERQGVHLARLSVNLKVSVAQLEALEADRHEAFKGIAFVRALALSVCRQLKIDPTEVMAALPQGMAPIRLEPAALEVQQRVSGVERVRPPALISRGLTRQVLLLAVLMLLGVGVLIWWPEPADPKVEVAESTPELQPAPMPMVEASDVTPVPAASDPTPVVPAVTGATTPTETHHSALVLLLSQDAWVSVRDKHREVAFKRQVKAGETVELSVDAPFFVYVSRADAVQVRWQGQRIDLSAHTQDNEVRLSIKP